MCAEVQLNLTRVPICTLKRGGMWRFKLEIPSMVWNEDTMTWEHGTVGSGESDCSRTRVSGFEMTKDLKRSSFPRDK